MENTANTDRPARLFDQDMLNGKTVLGVSPSWTSALALGEAHGIAATTDLRLVLDLVGGDRTLTKDHVIVCKGLDSGEHIEIVKAIQKAAGNAGATVILMPITVPDFDPITDLDPTTSTNLRVTARAIDDDVASGISVEDALTKLGDSWSKQVNLLAHWSPSVQAMLNKREVLREQAVLREALDEAEPEADTATPRGRRRL